MGNQTDTSIYDKLNEKPADPIGQIASMARTQQTLRQLGAGQPYNPNIGVVPNE